jgi:hypothetical protein
MLSPAIRESRKRATFTNGTAKLPPLAGTPSQSPLLVPRKVPGAAQGSPRYDDVITEGEAVVVRRQIGKGSEVPFVRRSRSGTAFDAYTEGHCLEIAVLDK